MSVGGSLQYAAAQARQAHRLLLPLGPVSRLQLRQPPIVGFSDVCVPAEKLHSHYPVIASNGSTS